MNPSPSSLPPIPYVRVVHLTAWAAIYFCASSYLLQFPRFILRIGGAAQDAGWLLALGLIPALTLGTWVGDVNRLKGARLPGVVGRASALA